MQTHMNQAAAASFISASVQKSRRGWYLNCRRQMRWEVSTPAGCVKLRRYAGEENFRMSN